MFVCFNLWNLTMIHKQEVRPWFISLQLFNSLSSESYKTQQVSSFCLSPASPESGLTGPGPWLVHLQMSCLTVFLWGVQCVLWASRGLLWAGFLFPSCRLSVSALLWSCSSCLKCIKTKININKRQDASAWSSAHTQEQHFTSEAPRRGLDLPSCFGELDQDLTTARSVTLWMCEGGGSLWAGLSSRFERLLEISSEAFCFCVDSEKWRNQPLNKGSSPWTWPPLSLGPHRPGPRPVLDPLHFEFNLTSSVCSENRFKGETWIKLFWINRK